MNGYDLSRNWFDFAFENPEKVKPVHSAVFFFIIEHANRSGWKEKIGLPSSMVMDAIGVKNWRTYAGALNDLVKFGFIKMIQKSKNQYTANIVAIVKNTKASTGALTTAIHNQEQKQDTTQSQSTVSIYKPQTNKPQTSNTDFGKKSGELKDSDFLFLLGFINEKTGRAFKSISPSSRKAYAKLLENGYTRAQIVKAIETAVTKPYNIKNGYENLTPEYFSRQETIDKFGVELTTQKPTLNTKDDLYQQIELKQHEWQSKQAQELDFEAEYREWEALKLKMTQLWGG
ncbi:hypothetical protein [Lishizhenia sp.]|uniref:hypothetical protein n=1 Tax=Lishizhenia sp. TaxID=2497594 RepID=UPI00299D1F3D|nr:hypothetical protein [Lishizhenia sp.]MDX1446625.1 hypothetical protein [Lishizhenia sp.]